MPTKLTVRCNICNKEMKGTSRLIKWIIKEHFENEHPTQFKACKVASEKYNAELGRETKRLNKKYPNTDPIACYTNYFEEARKLITQGGC